MTNTLKITAPGNAAINRRAFAIPFATPFSAKMARTAKLSALSAAISLTVVTATPASAEEAEWNISPQVQIQTGHNSNLRLTRGTQDAVLESTAQAVVTAKRRTETSDVSLSGGYNIIRYGNEADDIVDRDQQFARGVLRKRWTRWAMGVSGGFRRDDLLRTIDGEIIDQGQELDMGAGTPALPNEPPADDLIDDDLDNPGFDIEQQVRREVVRAAAYGQYELTERDRLRLGYSYASRDYSAGDLIVNIRDNKRHAVDAQYARDVSERSVVMLTLTASRLETDSRNPLIDRLEADFYQGLVTWRARINPYSQLEIGAGASYVDAEANDSTGFLLRVRGTTQVAGGRLSAEARRTLVPNAFGNVAETDLFRLRYNRTLSERWSYGFTATGQFRERLNDDQQVDRDLVRAGISASWTIAPEWTLTSGYDYAWIDRKGDANSNAGTADGHRVTLGVAWAPQNIRIGK